MLFLLIFAVVMGTFLLGKYEERAKWEDRDLEALKRINERSRHG